MFFDPEAYRDLLGAELARRTQSNPSYSQRAFARQLEMSPGELSEILRGKRVLSLKAMVKIAKALGLVDEAEVSPTVTTPLTLDLFALVSDWYALAIVSLAECRHFRWDEAWIAGRLGITALDVRRAIDRLVRVGILKKHAGSFAVVKDFVMSPDGIPSEAIRQFHRQILSKAIAALDGQTVTERMVTGITFSFDPKKVPLMKKEISDFLQKMGRKYGKSPRPTDVYQLELALFRLTEGEKHAS